MQLVAGRREFPEASYRIVDLVGSSIGGVSMETRISLKRALRLLVEAYPDSKIKIMKTKNPYADKMIVMDRSFVAWVEAGGVILREAPLLKELLEKKKTENKGLG